MDTAIIGARVLIRSCMPVGPADSHETEWLGSDLDGAFAQFTVVRARDVFAGASKRERVLEIGADEVLERGQDPVARLGAESVDAVIDNVAGDGFGSMLAVLRHGGVYVTSGAIAGPIVELDLRTLYLHDLRLLGCTAWDEHVFADVVSYLERGEIRPLLERTYPLRDIAAAQREFLEKRHVGNIVLLLPE